MYSFRKATTKHYIFIYIKNIISFFFLPKGFENEDYMVEELTKDGSLEGSAGVVFQIGDAPTNQLPDGQIKYKV